MAAGWIAGTPVSIAEEPQASEYQVKAVFLFNFTQFVDWPADAFADDSTPFTIEILGEDPFGSSLDEIVANEKIHNRRLLVRRIHTIEELGPCHILFISQSEAGNLDRIFSMLGRRSILTVGESKEFTAHSGVIAFDVSGRRLRLRINVGAARDARLRIDSKLLRQAQIVDSREPGQ